MAKYQDSIADSATGRPIANVTVQVFEYPSGDPATLYTAEGEITTAPITSNSDGDYSFHALVGRYNIVYYHGGITKTLTDVQVGGMQGIPGPASSGYTLLSSYGSLPAMVSAIGVASQTVGIDASTTLSSNITIPANIELLPLNGAVINHGAYTISYAGSTARWPVAQIFNGTGLVSLSGPSESRPEWFGAKGDWSGTAGTDDSAAILAAIKAAKVSILDGNYAVGASGSIFISGLSDKHIKGKGTLHKTGNRGIFSFYQCTDITVEGLTLDGQIAADEAANGKIYPLPATRASIDLSFAISFNDCIRCTASNNHIYDFANDGIRVIGVVASDGLTATQCSTIKILGNRLSNIRGTQIWLTAVDNFYIEKNIGSNEVTFAQKANFIFIVEWCTNGFINKNKAYFIGDNAIGIGQLEHDVVAAVNKNIVVSENIMKTSRYHSILIASAWDVLVDRNIIEQSGAKDNMPGDTGTVVTGAITLVGGVDGSADEPVNHRITVTNNIIKDPYEFGIYAYDRVDTTLANSSTGIVLADNTIVNVAKLALATRLAAGAIKTQYKTPVSIAGNKIGNVTGRGILVYGDAVVTNNKISGVINYNNDGYGIQVPQDTIFTTEKNTLLSGAISGNVVSNTTRTGISVALRSSAVITDNNTTNCGIDTAPGTENVSTAADYAGISAYKVDSTTLSGNTAKGNGSSGIVGRLAGYVAANTNGVIYAAGNILSGNGVVFTTANLRSGAYLEGDATNAVKATFIGTTCLASGTQQYPIRILYGGTSTSVDERSDTHGTSTTIGATIKLTNAI